MKHSQPKFEDKIRIGFAGELRVMSELIRRGFNPAKSYFDNGIDIILDDGKKIQVKTSEYPTGKGTIGQSRGYRFRLLNFEVSYDKMKYHISSKSRRLEKPKVDYYIFWCVEDDDFYIIPFKDLKGFVAISLMYPIKRKRYGSKWDKFKDNWELLK